MSCRPMPERRRYQTPTGWSANRRIVRISTGSGAVRRRSPAIPRTGSPVRRARGLRTRQSSGTGPRLVHLVSCPAFGPPCTWTPPLPSRSAWRPMPPTRCAPGCRRAPGEHAHTPVRELVRDLLLRVRHGRQVAYHLLAQAEDGTGAIAITTIVFCLPVLVLAMRTALAHMLRADAAAGAPDSVAIGPATAWGIPRDFSLLCPFCQFVARPEVVAHLGVRRQPRRRVTRCGFCCAGDTA